MHTCRGDSNYSFIFLCWYFGFQPLLGTITHIWNITVFNCQSTCSLVHSVFVSLCLCSAWRYEFSFIQCRHMWCIHSYSYASWYRVCLKNTFSKSLNSMLFYQSNVYYNNALENSNSKVWKRYWFYLNLGSFELKQKMLGHSTNDINDKLWHLAWRILSYHK